METTVEPLGVFFTCVFEVLLIGLELLLAAVPVVVVLFVYYYSKNKAKDRVQQATSAGQNSGKYQHASQTKFPNNQVAHNTQSHNQGYFQVTGWNCRVVTNSNADRRLIGELSPIMSFLIEKRPAVEYILEIPNLRNIYARIERHGSSNLGKSTADPFQGPSSQLTKILANHPAFDSTYSISTNGYVPSYAWLGRIFHQNFRNQLLSDAFVRATKTLGYVQSVIPHAFLVTEGRIVFYSEYNPAYTEERYHQMMFKVIEAIGHNVRCLLSEPSAS